MEDGVKVSAGDVRKSVAVLQKRVPSLFCGLNVAQYAALKSAYTIDSAAGAPPALNIISFANGVGKTHLMVLDMIGFTMGHEHLNWQEFPPEAVAFYSSLSKLRDAGQLSLRLVCAADDAKEGGSIVDILKKLFPMARLTAKDQLGTFRQIDVPHPTIRGVVNHIAIKTFEQAVVKHSGSTCLRVWINEPLPSHLVGETVGRIRSPKGGVPGSIMMCATLLDEANWVQELGDDPALRMCHTRGHLYENCVGEDVTDTMAVEVLATIGRRLKKNPGGKGYVTNGILAKEQIDAMCALWRSSCPGELEARKTGAPISGGGKVYPNFKRGAHVIDDYKPNPKFPVVMVVDPHAAKPSFVIWCQISPQDRLYIFDEWPSANEGYYENLSERRLTISQECEAWGRLEAGHGISGDRIIRVGDPNRFREPNPFTNETLQKEYKKFGFNFDTNVSDDLAVGHAAVNSSLWFDEFRLAANPNDITALPRLFIAKKCTNTIRALENYAFKRGAKDGASITEKVNHRFKDGADVIRYLCVWHRGNLFAAVQDRETGSSDFAKFSRGRIPAMYRNQQASLLKKGRRVAV